MSREKYGSLALSVLLVSAAVVAGVGLTPFAAAQTDTYSKTYVDGGDGAGIDLSNVTTETTIEVVTDESPAGNGTVILRKDVPASEDKAEFRNQGAYNEYTVRVEGADAQPEFYKLSVPISPYSGFQLGDTGGDPGFTYDTMEKIAAAANPRVPQLDSSPLPGQTNVDTSSLDASQTELEIYQSAQNDKASQTNYHTTLENYLQDSKTTARIIGKNAYIEALNNGSSESAARSEAKNAVAEYYSIKQANLLNEYNRGNLHNQYLRSTAANKTGVNEDYVNISTTYNSPENNYGTIQDVRTGTKTVTLVNGTSATSQTFGAYFRYQTQSGNYASTAAWYDVGINDNPRVVDDYSTMDLNGWRVLPPTTDYDRLQSLNQSRFYNNWNEIQTQNQQVQSDMDTLVNGTYTEYQEGEINNTDLVDPYTLSSEFSAGDEFQSYAAAQLTMIGTNSPENLDQTGSFEVTTETNNRYEGVLFSADNPTSGEFASGQTYNPSNINGTQYIVTPNKTVELTENFTLGNITTSSGEQIANVTIQKTQYQTTNVTELKQLYEDLAMRQAEIEARKAALVGGGGILAGENSVVILAVAGAALFLIARD